MATLSIKVVPGASRNRIAGRYGDALKVQVAAPPEKGKANEAVIAVIAEALSLRPSQIKLIAGATQPRKTLRIDGLDEAELQRRLAERGVK